MFLHQTTTIKLISNHLIVVYYHVPTSNHNRLAVLYVRLGLYIIMFLHQTTTIASLHKIAISCILSCSYIKPQPGLIHPRVRWVVYYHVPTSNHNLCNIKTITFTLYIIMFLHQTTTNNVLERVKLRCILSCSYIKPQLSKGTLVPLEGCILSCSYIKPQLERLFTEWLDGCILSCSYIKPQPFNS